MFHLGYTITLVGSYSSGGIMINVKVVGNYAYVTQNDSICLNIIDISDPSAPSSVSAYTCYCPPLNHRVADGLAISNNYAYLAYNEQISALRIINISNPLFPELSGQLSSSFTWIRGMEISGKYLYMTGDSGLTIVDISDPANPIITGTYNMFGLQAHDVFIQNDTNAFISHYIQNLFTSGFAIINVKTPTSSTLSSLCTTTVAPIKIEVNGNYAYLANGDSGIQIANIENSAAPTIVSTCRIGGYVSNIKIVNNYIFATVRDKGFYVINAANPLSPIIVDSFLVNLDANFNYIDIQGQNAFITDHNLLIFDVSKYVANENIPQRQISLNLNIRPNPFNGTTQINYIINNGSVQYKSPHRTKVNLSIYDCQGRLIEVLVNANMNNGSYFATWTGQNQTSGLYLIVLKNDQYTVNAERCLMIK